MIFHFFVKALFRTLTKRLLFIKGAISLFILMVTSHLVVGAPLIPSSYEHLPTQQERVISGTVTDDTGSPLEGVTVTLQDTRVGTTTSANGGYQLTVRGVDPVLLFTILGFGPMEVQIGVENVINIALNPLVSDLDEVVVVGYGTQKKVNLTGAVAVIGNDDLDGRQVSTVSQLLQGQGGGLNFSMSNEGFQPGAEVGITIRGMGSLSGGSPFVVIDGIPGNMNTLNPNDIESITVLKDASSAAIYGARAAFGVILITTKAGLKNKPSVTYSTNLSVSFAPRLPEYLNSVTYAKVENEQGLNAGGRPYTDAAIDRMRAFINKDWDYLRQFTVPDATHFESIPLDNGTWAEYYDGHANYDWFDEFYSGGKFNQNHNMSIRGGTEGINYYLSSGYINQPGILNYGVDDFKRMNILGRIGVSITSWWDLTYAPRFMKSNREKFNMGREGSYDLAFHQIARAKPMMPMFDGYGNYTEKSMIPEIESSGTNATEIIENWHAFSTEVRPLKNWKFNIDFAAQFTDGYITDTDLLAYSYRVDGTAAPIGITQPDGISRYHSSNSYLNTNIYSNYDFTLANDHNFTFLLGTQMDYSRNRDLTARKNGLLVQDQVLSLQTAIGDPTVLEQLLDWSTAGYFSRLNYNYKGRYLFEANVRRDGTSRFQQGKRWGTFPSFSAGWNIAQENFWAHLTPVISTFKLRGSWGKLGNQDVSPYQDLGLIPINTGALNWLWNYGGNRPIGYTMIPTLVSPFLTWETTTNKNVGLDVTGLTNRLSLSFDVFERTTDRMLGPAEAKPGVLGANMPSENNAALRTRGWDLMIGWREQASKDWSYNINFNLSDNVTVITKYNNPTGSLTTWYNGKQDGEIWGYVANELYRYPDDLRYTDQIDMSFLYGGDWRTGDVKYEDINGDGAVNNGTNTIYDHGDLKIIGNSSPRFIFGLSGGFSWKNLDFSMVWQGILKRDIWFDANQNMFWGFRTVGQTSLYERHLDYYRDQPGTPYAGLHEGDANINTNSYFPRPYLVTSDNNRNRHPSTRYLQNGAYLRLQNIQIGYTLQGGLLSRIKMQSVRMFLSGENLLTLSKLPLGVDPLATRGTFGMGKTYGADRVVSFGLTISY